MIRTSKVSDLITPRIQEDEIDVNQPSPIPTPPPVKLGVGELKDGPEYPDQPQFGPSTFSQAAFYAPTSTPTEMVDALSVFQNLGSGEVYDSITGGSHATELSVPHAIQPNSGDPMIEKAVEFIRTGSIAGKSII